jgi:hypothetical protein
MADLVVLNDLGKNNFYLQISAFMKHFFDDAYMEMIKS